MYSLNILFFIIVIYLYHLTFFPPILHYILSHTLFKIHGFFFLNFCYIYVHAFTVLVTTLLLCKDPMTVATFLKRKILIGPCFIKSFIPFLL